MSRSRCIAVLLCAGTFIGVAASARGDQQADALYAQYKAAKAKGEYDAAEKYVCDAAKIDTKYQAECDSVTKYVEPRLSDFENDIILARADLGRGDCQSALTHASAITFGPHLAEAKDSVTKARYCIEHPGPSDADLWKAAQLAYQNNNFATADQNAAQVKSPELLSLAQNMRNNIKNYTIEMQLGDDLFGRKDYPGAAQQYQAAARIKADGPGNPQDKLLKAQQAIAKPKPGPGPGPNPPEPEPAWKTDLKNAQEAAAKGDCAAARPLYTRVLQAMPNQPEAISVQNLCQGGEGLEKALAAAVQDYYDANFTQASDAINIYLNIGGKRKGAAYFYLGAAKISQAFLSDPKDKKEYDKLQQSALEAFRQAKQANFKPVEKFVSPKILAVWTQAGM